MKSNVVEIREAKLPDDIDTISQLWTDYLIWGNYTMQQSYGVHPHNPQETVAEDIKLIDKFMPPHGRIMLAFVDENACGIGCLKNIDGEIGEIKRMYVAPAFRKIGAGNAILESLVDTAKATGYRKLRLDSPKFMEDAHALYRRFGFKDIAAYEVEIPESFRQYLLFMELDLT